MFLCVRKCINATQYFFLKGYTRTVDSGCLEREELGSWRTELSGPQGEGPGAGGGVQGGCLHSNPALPLLTAFGKLFSLCLNLLTCSSSNLHLSGLIASSVSRDDNSSISFSSGRKA